MDIFRKINMDFYIIPIFFLALFIRFFNIFDIGLFHWDSGYFVNTALWLVAGVGSPYPWNPPLYSLFVGFLFLLFGIYDWLAISVSAFFGSLTVIVTYLIAKEIFDIKTAVISSLFLALNQIHIIYSRTALLDSTFTFFFVISLLFFIYAIKKSRISFYIIYGAFLGITLNVKYNGFQAFIIPLTFLLLYYLYTRFRNISTKIKFLTALKGMIIAFFIMCMMHIPWIFALGIGSYMMDSGSYSLQSFSQTDSNILTTFSNGLNLYYNIFTKTKAPLLFNTNNILFYPYVILLWTNPLLIICFLFSFFEKKKREQLFIFIWFLFILLFFSFGYKAPRTIIPIIPAFSILSAIGALKITDLMKNNIIKKYDKKKILVVIIMIVFLTSIPNIINAISNTHNGYRIAGNFLKENIDEDKYIFYIGGPNIRFYYPEASWWKFCSNVSSKEIDYIVIDYLKYNYKDEYQKIFENIQKDTELLAEFDNNVILITTISQINFDNRKKDDFEKISIYKLGTNQKKYLLFLDKLKEKKCLEI